MPGIVSVFSFWMQSLSLPCINFSNTKLDSPVILFFIIAVFHLAASVGGLQDLGALRHQGGPQGRDGQVLRRRPHAQDEAAEAPGTSFCCDVVRFHGNDVNFHTTGNVGCSDTIGNVLKCRCKHKFAYCAM